MSLLFKGLSRVFSNTTIQKHQFFGAQSSVWSNSHPYMTIRKTMVLTIWTFVGKVMSLLFNTLSRFVIALLPKSKRLFISWLQTPSAVILEPKKIKSVTFPTSIWMGMGKFNSDDYLLPWTRIPCPQGISLVECGVALIVNKGV